MTRRRACLLTLLGLGNSAAWAQSPPAPQGELLSAADLMPRLRRGGLVIYFRHTATDFSRRDDAMKDFDDCDNQRPLSAQGRADAALLGQRIRALRLPVDEVLASPMCRTMEHARLSFGRATPTPELRERQDGDFPGLKRLLALPVPAGRNRWIVSHGIPFRAATGLPPLAEGEASVFRPGAGEWSLLGRITIDAWPALKPAR